MSLYRNFLHSLLPLWTCLRTRQFQLMCVPTCMNVCSKQLSQVSQGTLPCILAKEKQLLFLSTPIRRRDYGTVFCVYVHADILALSMHRDRLETILVWLLSLNLIQLFHLLNSSGSSANNCGNVYRIYMDMAIWTLC